MLARFLFLDENHDGDLLRASMRAVSVVGGVAHLAFLALFVWMDLPWLAALNVVSVSVFVWGWRLFGRRRYNFGLVVMSAEIIVHAIAAVVTLGLDSGFQYYLLSLIAPLGVAMRAAPVWRFFGVLVVTITFQGLNLALPGQAMAVRSPVVLAWLSSLNLATTIAIMAFLAFYYASLIDESHAALRLLATTDPLTGLANRRHLLMLARDAAAGARTPRCILLFDIDHFKRVNDRHGHDVGDQALQFVAKLLARDVRPGDAVARWGGEEFVAVLRDTDRDTALCTAERLRRSVEEARFNVRAAGGETSVLPLTITIGVAEVGADEDIEFAINRADAALYRGKSDGRNCVRQMGEMACA